MTITAVVLFLEKLIGWFIQYMVIYVVCSKVIWCISKHHIVLIDSCTNVLMSLTVYVYSKDNNNFKVTMI